MHRVDCDDGLVRVTAAVVIRDGRVLAARRRAGTALEGHWEFPGGKLEPGETPEACLAREIREELGLDARVGEFLLASRDHGEPYPIELLVYEARLDGEVTGSTDHDLLRWVPVGELGELRWAPADVPVVRWIQRHRSNPDAGAPRGPDRT